MFIVGLTGGVGSGKSTVAREMERLGAYVIDADQVARDVVEPGTPALASVAERFGPEILDADGALNRRKLREIVFANPGEREWLEQLLHPLINRTLAQRIAASTAPYAVLVSPLLLETGQRDMVQRILVVDCPEHIQVQRTSERDGCAPEQVRGIMAAQMSRDARLSGADDVVRNDGDLDHLLQQVRAVHETYLAEAGKPDGA